MADSNVDWALSALGRTLADLQLDNEALKANNLALKKDIARLEAALSSAKKDSVLAARHKEILNLLEIRYNLRPDNFDQQRFGAFPSPAPANPPTFVGQTVGAAFLDPRFARMDTVYVVYYCANKDCAAYGFVADKKTQYHNALNATLALTAFGRKWMNPMCSSCLDIKTEIGWACLVRR